MDHHGVSHDCAETERHRNKGISNDIELVAVACDSSALHYL